MEDTKQRILKKSLELFSAKGYDAVSVGEIAKAVGIKAPSLYNHFPSKQAIFDAIVESTAAHYEKDTGRIDIHVQNVKQDCPTFSHISEQALADKVRQIFLYSLHDKQISQFRRMMTLEQFRSPELAALFSERYVVLGTLCRPYDLLLCRYLPFPDRRRRNSGRGPGYTGMDVCFPYHRPAERLRPSAGTRIRKPCKAGRPCKAVLPYL